MVFYTKKQYQSAIQEAENKTDEIIDSFRDVILEQLESIVKSDEYKGKYELLLRGKGYYESIKRDLQTEKDRDKIFKKYDLCFIGNGYGNSKCWYLLDKIEYKDNRLRFYIDGYWSFPPDYAECDCKQIPSKVLWCALKEFKNHIKSPIIKENTKNEEDKSQETVTIDNIMLFLNEKGFQPQKQNDEYISFKFQDNTFEIHYSESCLDIFKRAKVEKEYVHAAEKAAAQTMLEAWFLKIFSMNDGSNCFFFSTQVYIETISEMEKYFPILFGQLTGGINRFNESFHHFWQEL